MPHGPAYNYSPDKMPEFFWTKPDGGVVGFWAHEWLDVLGEAVLKETDHYDWEVWQPDYRADQVYSKILPTGVTHKLFPAEDRLYRVGIRSQVGIFSGTMMERLKELQGCPLVLMLYGTYGFRVPFYHEILKIFDRSRFPIFLRSGGMFKTPLGEILGLHRPLTYLSLIIEHLELKKLFRQVDVISEQSGDALKKVRKIYGGRVEKLTMGCDFDFWTPVMSAEVKRTIQDKLNIPQGKKVFFASGNFVPRKQLDKLIEVFNSLREHEDFFLIIAGQGDQAYTDMLAGLSAPLAKLKKAILHPYVTGAELRNIYWASDLYVSVATDEGGPASVMKAMACGLPVISTPVGETADKMIRYKAGKIVPVKKYSEWTKAILEILDKGMPRVLDREIAREAYDWPNVAKRFIRIYDDLISAYYKTKY